jgi:hypothetical protein
MPWQLLSMNVGEVNRIMISNLAGKGYRAKMDRILVDKRLPVP